MRKSLLILLLVVLVPQWSQGQDSTRMHVIGIGNETLSIISNYPSFLSYIDYTYKNDYVFAVGFGPVLSSEFFLIDGASSHKNAYNSFFEFKWYPFPDTEWFRPFIGLGYGYLSSNFETEYIVLTGEYPYTYFVNHTVELETSIKTTYIPIGIRIHLVKDILYLEPSVRIQWVNKTIDWSEPLISGALKSNENIGRNLTEYRSPVDPFILEGGILEGVGDNFMFSIKFGYRF